MPTLNPLMQLFNHAACGGFKQARNEGVDQRGAASQKQL